MALCKDDHPVLRAHRQEGGLCEVGGIVQLRPHLNLQHLPAGVRQHHQICADRLPGDVKIRIRDGQIGKEKPLIIIDGVEQIKDDAIDKLNPNIIESISVLKDESSVKLYGERGKDGVILITTKNASTKKK